MSMRSFIRRLRHTANPNDRLTTVKIRLGSDGREHPQVNSSIVGVKFRLNRGFKIWLSSTDR
jgi:hypothetical protein